MPELPEVEVVRRGLAEHVTGRRIGSVRLGSARVSRRHLPGPADLSARLAGAEVRAVDRRGKYLWLVVDLPGGPARALVLHLGMSGQLLVGDPAAPPVPHQHATFDFADGGSQLRFVDQRTFGGMTLADLLPDRHAAGAQARARGIPEPVAHIAPDPFEDAFDPEAVVARGRARRTEVKRALLDQQLVSGIGNIYADEALWRAQVHGRRPAGAISRPRWRRLLGAARDVMAEALAQGGTSFDPMYVDVNGASGYFDRSLRAYGQAGRPCARCGAAILREPFMNRSSFFCPRCQPRPRVVRQVPRVTAGRAGGA